MAQIERYFTQASKKANLPQQVTSCSLRPMVKAQRASRRRKIRTKNGPRKISEEEWARIAPKIYTTRSSAGRKSSYDLRDLLNGILYHLTTDCPIKKLPSGYPPGSVLDSQYRRWKKNGVMLMVEKELGMLEIAKSKAEN